MADRADPAETDAHSRGGTYSLLLDLAEPAEIEVGALGELSFDAGRYVYTGSAFGPGGFARIDRHREIAAGERDVRHWHVDYLLGYPATTIDAVWISPNADRECAIARDLPGDPVPRFGASDCDCEAHLVATPVGSARTLGDSANAPDDSASASDDTADAPEPLADALARLHDRRHRTATTQE